MNQAKSLLAISVLLASVALLIGCAANKNTKTALEKEYPPEEDILEQLSAAEFDGEMEVQFDFGVRKGHYSGALNDSGIPDGDGSFSTKNADGAAWTYTGTWDNGHFKYGRTEWSSGSYYEGNYLNDVQNGIGVYAFEDGTRYVGEFEDGFPLGKGTAYYTDGAYFEGIFSSFNDATGYFCDTDDQRYNAALVDGELIIKPVEDFLSDENRQARYKELYISYQYSALKDFLQEYIDTKNPAQSDSAFTILEHVEPVLQYEDQWLVTYDEFDCTYSVKFKDASEISYSNSVDVTVTGTGIDYRVGFKRNGWLFFDELAISADGEVVYSTGVKSYDVTRNVISGREVEEYYFAGISDKDAEIIYAADAVVLRFKNRTSGESYDHQLTQAEKDALYCGMLLRKNNMELSNIAFRFNNR